VTRYHDDPRVAGSGHDGYAVTRDDGTDYQVLPTGVFGWVVCHGPNLDFAPTADGGFAIGFATADDAIGAALGEQPSTADTATAESASTEATVPETTAEDGDDTTDGM
jgi:hypothetical protein